MVRADERGVFLMAVRAACMGTAGSALEFTPRRPDRAEASA